MKSPQTPIERYLVPPGPSHKYDSATDLFNWLKENFERFGDIYRTSVFGGEVYVVSSPEYCEYILRRNWQNYSRKGLVVQRIALALGNNLITSNGEAWSSQRRMIQPAFTKSAIDRSIDMMVAANAELLEEWLATAKQGGTVNVTRDVSLMVLKITLKSIFGEDYETIAPGFRLFAEETARDLKFAENLAALRAQIMEVVTLRRRQGRSSPDNLGVILQARDRERRQPMPDAQLVREVLNLVVAGHETTASLLNWMWYLLATHPEAQTKLGVEFDELPWEGNLTIDMLQNYTFARKVINEALRLYPPLWLMSRKSLKDDYLGEYFVPAGTEIYISPYLIQRSPQLWHLPDRFDPDRRDFDTRALSFCPFGAGPRKCIGDVFARVEIQIHLMMFAKEFFLSCSETRVPEITTGLNLLSKHDFKMLPEIKRSSDGDGLKQ